MGDTLSARNESPKPAIRSIQGNQYRFGFGLTASNINRNKDTAYLLKTRQNESKLAKENISNAGLQGNSLQENINDQLIEYFQNNKMKNSTQNNLNSFGTSASLSPFLLICR